jgi:DNA-binding NarL/FixJ family response regulator
MFPLFVVIVDRDPRFLDIATRFLQKREGLLVYSAVSTSNEILNQVGVFVPDVILYNLGNSETASLGTIRQLRKKLPGLTLIVVAPPENEKYKKAVLEAGADNFVIRHAMSLEFLPAIWSLVTLYQQRYGQSGVSTFTGTNAPIEKMMPDPGWEYEVQPKYSH